MTATNKAIATAEEVQKQNRAATQEKEYCPTSTPEQYENTVINEASLINTEELCIFTDWITSAEERICLLRDRNDDLLRYSSSHFALYSHSAIDIMIDEMAVCVERIKTNIEHGEIPASEMGEKLAKYINGEIFLNEFAMVCLIHADTKFDSLARRCYHDIRDVVQGEKLPVIARLRRFILKHYSSPTEIRSSAENCSPTEILSSAEIRSLKENLSSAENSRMFFNDLAALTSKYYA